MTFDDRSRAGVGGGVRSGGVMGLLATAAVVLSACWAGCQIVQLADTVAAGPGATTGPPPASCPTLTPADNPAVAQNPHRQDTQRSPHRRHSTSVLSL